MQYGMGRDTKVLVQVEQLGEILREKGRQDWAFGGIVGKSN